MNTTRGLLNYLDMTAEDVARLMLQKGYRKDVAVSIYCCGDSDKEEKFKEHFPVAYTFGERSNRDWERDHITGEKHKRTPVEKLSDIAANFFVEDLEIEMMKSGGMDVTLNLTDADRSFIDRRKQSAEADCIVTVNNCDIKVELVNDYGSFWRDLGRCTLRNDKAYSCRKQKAVVVGFNLPNQLCFVRDAATLKDREITKAFNFNGYDIPVEMHELDPAYIADTVKDIAEQRYVNYELDRMADYRTDLALGK